MLDRLKRFNTDAADLEELVAMSSFARALRAEFESLSVEVPSWLDEKAKEVRRAVQAVTDDQRQKHLRELKSRQTALMPIEERRKAIADEIARLEQLTKAV